MGNTSIEVVIPDQRVQELFNPAPSLAITFGDVQDYLLGRIELDAFRKRMGVVVLSQSQINRPTQLVELIRAVAVQVETGDSIVLKWADWTEIYRQASDLSRDGWVDL